MAATMAILKIYKLRLLQNSKSEWAQTWWKALGWHGDLDLLNLFSSKMATMVASLKILKQHLLSNGKWINIETWWPSVKIAEMVMLRWAKWQPELKI